MVTKHISNIFSEGELDEQSNVQNLHISGSGRPVKFYDLDVIISVGYRVKSHRGVQFRKWATGLIKEYLIKGFTMNDELLKEVGGGNYFDELLARIRETGRPKKYPGAKYWISMLPASIMILRPKCRLNFSKPSKIKCIGPLTAIQRQKLSFSELMQINQIWV